LSHVRAAMRAAPRAAPKAGCWQVLTLGAILTATEKETSVPDFRPDQKKNLVTLPDDAAAAESARKVRQHVEDLLDQALEESFPASDPPSIALPPGWENRT
jgi:hypothetical protein